jgi:phage baseplate assembly protein W
VAESVENELVDPDVIFRGIGFPFRRGDEEIPKAATDDELLADTLAQLILTAPGTRVMRPELGSGATAFAFETNDEVLAGLIRTTVGNVIARFESRVIVRRIDVVRSNVSKTDTINKDSVTITVNYVVPATQETNSVSIQVGLNQGVVE